MSIRLALIAPIAAADVIDNDVNQLRMVLVDRDGAWARATGSGGVAVAAEPRAAALAAVAADPMVLVRPDGHVAWVGYVDGAAEEAAAVAEGTVGAAAVGIVDALRRTLGW